MSGWWIIPAQGIVTIDDALLKGVDCSSIPANIYMVRWWKDHGEVLYNHADRLPIREPFVDLSPYVPIFDAFMTLAETSPPPPSPPISVDQAKFVKNSMTSALSNAKQQAPFPHSVAAGDYQWDPNNPMGNASLGSTTQNLVVKTNEIASRLNVTIPKLDAMDAQIAVGASESDLLLSAGYPPAAFPGGGTPWTPVDSVAGPPDQLWVPVGASAPVHVTTAEAQAIMQGIADRSNKLIATQNKKSSDVNKLTTVSAVVAYDILGGW